MVPSCIGTVIMILTLQANNVANFWVFLLVTLLYKVLGIRFFVLKESKMMGVLYGSQNGDDGMMGGLIKYVMPHWQPHWLLKKCVDNHID